MKTILAGVAFAALMTSPLFAQSQSVERPLYARTSQVQKTQSRMDAWAFDGVLRSGRPAPNADLMNAGLCSTAPSFCPGYHGDNGG